VQLARKYGVDPAQMALAFVRQQPFVGSTIIGATTMEQLRSNFASAEVTLPAEVMAEIESIHQLHPNPAP
ncbi:MAG: aldo/keto reductase, partial [Mariprofundales bacterium]|nr:aldo/keto reductase [Mariprofundales bacterium]